MKLDITSTAKPQHHLISNDICMEWMDERVEMTEGEKRFAEKQ